jgi:hypothetical protein
MQGQLKTAALVVALSAAACGGGTHTSEPGTQVDDDGAWMDDAVVVVERNVNTGRETVTLVDSASGRSLVVNDEPLTPEANEADAPSAPIAAALVAALPN